MSTNHVDARNNNSPKKRVSMVRVLVVVAVAMSLYAFGRLSNSDSVMFVLLLLAAVLETVHLIGKYRKSTRLYVGCEAAYFIVLLSIFLGPYRNSLSDHIAFFIATVFYQPYYTLYCNRRLAFAIGLLIMAVVLPVTCGIVADAGFADLLAATYALLVVSLWAFCSKLGAMVFGFSPATETGGEAK